MNATNPRAHAVRSVMAKTPEEWRREHERQVRTARLAAPGWGFDRLYVNVLAADVVLPRLCAELGLGPAIAKTARPDWWPFPSPIPGPDGVILALRAAHFGRWATCLIDLATWEWAINGPPVARTGRDLIELAAFIWGGSEAKAAHRITRMAGRTAPWAA